MAAEPDAGMMSSSSISSPPTSPHHANDTIRVSHSSNSLPRNLYGGVVAAAAAPASSPQPSLPATSIPAHATTPNAASASTTTTPNNASATEKPKRQRKKKDVQLGPDGQPIVDEKPKKQRKPREPKEKTVGNGAPPPRKKVKTEPKADDKAANDVASPPRQPTLTGMLGGFQPSSKPTPTPAALAPPSSTQHLRVSEPSTHQSTTPTMSTPPPSRPISSGQNYDPIRGSTMAARMSNPPNGAHTSQSTAFVNRASASPSIASLIDPPVAPLVLSPPQAATQRPHAPLPQQTSSTPKPDLAAPPPQNSASKPDSAFAKLGDTMEMDTSVNVPGRQIPDIKTPSKSSSSAGPAPKAARRSPEPLKGTGSGLLSTSDLFGGGGSSDPLERKGVNIDLHIPLNPKGGNNINIAQEIIKKYGREAINPRAAAHREQLLRIAAEQDRLAGTSNDEMSVDLLSDMEGDSNVEMGGMDDEKSNTGIDGDKPKKRKKRGEEYDKEDDFIDDTELAWQEQAAVAKDGFFVYSGPLIPEGQQAQIESSAPTRGGRGRGRGSRGGRTANAGTTHASLADKSRDTTTTTTTTTTTRGRGSRGGRGTGAPRKPRVTKADKEKMASASATGSVAATPAPTTTQSALQQASTATTPQAPQSSPPAQVVGGVA